LRSSIHKAVKAGKAATRRVHDFAPPYRDLTRYGHGRESVTMEPASILGADPADC
jgi:hypothetical protein